MTEAGQVSVAAAEPLENLQRSLEYLCDVQVPAVALSSATVKNRIQWCNPG